jgi:predicted nucleotide-binding protein
MESSKLLELLKNALNEVPRLLELPYGNSDYMLWRHKVEDILRAEFGVRSHEFTRFLRVVTGSSFNSDDLNQKEYLRRLQEDETALKSIVWEVEMIGAKPKPEAKTLGEAPKAFIAHEGQTRALTILKEFLEALGIEYFIAESKASDGRSIEKQVDWTQSKADFAVCLATKGKAINKKTGKHYMAPNIIDELGRARQVFGNKIILLVQKGVEVHTNVGEIVRETFTTTNMERAFIKITKELRNWGFIRVGKPKE